MDERVVGLLLITKILLGAGFIYPQSAVLLCLCMACYCKVMISYKYTNAFLFLQDVRSPESSVSYIVKS